MTFKRFPSYICDQGQIHHWFRYLVLSFSPLTPTSKKEMRMPGCIYVVVLPHRNVAKVQLDSTNLELSKAKESIKTLTKQKEEGQKVVATANYEQQKAEKYAKEAESRTKQAEIVQKEAESKANQASFPNSLVMVCRSFQCSRLSLCRCSSNWSSRFPSICRVTS